jgi:hypothetical protein
MQTFNPIDKKVFVGGLHWQSNEQSVYGYFAQFGEIEQVKLIQDKQTGRSKGYGFVIFSTPEAAQRAVVNGYPVIDGKKCNCNLASLGVKADPPQHEKRKRNYHDYNGPTAGPTAGPPFYIPEQTYVEYPTGYPQDKRRKMEPPMQEFPQITYLQQLEQEGNRITLDEAKVMIEQNRLTEPTEAFKLFLEVSEIFRNSAEYETYYKTLLESARRVRVQQAISDGQTSGLVQQYPQLLPPGV